MTQLDRNLENVIGNANSVLWFLVCEVKIS